MAAVLQGSGRQLYLTSPHPWHETDYTGQPLALFYEWLIESGNGPFREYDLTWAPGDFRTFLRERAPPLDFRVPGGRLQRWMANNFTIRDRPSLKDIHQGSGGKSVGFPSEGEAVFIQALLEEKLVAGEGWGPPQAGPKEAAPGS